MNRVAKNIEMSNCIAIFGDGFVLPDPKDFISLFTQEELRGANFADDPVMRLKVFDLPTKKFKYIFEGNRIRLEDYGFREPTDSLLVKELVRIVKAIYPNIKPVAYGFNYDAIYRFDSIVPQREVTKNFIEENLQEQVKHFGWQYTLSKEKGRRLETYFFKVVSPIEIRLHSNFHFNYDDFLYDNRQGKFERCYTLMDQAIEKLAF